MSSFEIEDNINFPYLFLTNQLDNWSLKEKAETELNEWCSDNCQGQWMISVTAINLEFYSPSKYESPIQNETYDPNCIEITDRYIIGFELEEDAVGFKLKFFGGGS